MRVIVTGRRRVSGSALGQGERTTSVPDEDESVFPSPWRDAGGPTKAGVPVEGLLVVADVFTERLACHGSSPM